MAAEATDRDRHASAPLGIEAAWARGATLFAEARAAGAYGLASMAGRDPLKPTAAKWAHEEISGLGYFAGESSRTHAAMKAYLREELAAAQNAARTEQRLSQEAGVEVRVAYDPNIDKAVALLPGDAGYVDVRGARASFARMRLELGRMGENADEYRRLLVL